MIESYLYPALQALILRTEGPRRSKTSSTSGDLQLEYQYQPLESGSEDIRLLILQPGSRNDPVQCTLQRVSIAPTSKPHYEATSYVWGDANLRASILIDGYSTSVPASSAEVLRRVRLVQEPRALWIDSICINQKDVTERSQQVGVMSQIYSRSRRNLVWLGEDDGTTEAAIASIHNIVHDLAQCTNGQLEDMLFDSSDNFRHTPTDSDVENNRSALRSFFSSPWFSRLWVVQEVARAPESICLRGEHQVAFVDVLRTIAWFSLNFRTQTWFPMSSLIEYPRLEFLLRLVGAGSVYNSKAVAKTKTVHILEIMRFFRATDPRDYVFGALGIHEKLAGSIPSGMSPDYSASYVEVYHRAALATIEHDRDLASLGLAGKRSGQPEDDLPSWVPRFNKTINKMHDPNPLHHLGTFAHGGNPLKLHKHNQSDNVLVVSGALLPGTVAAAVPSLCQYDGSDAFLDFLDRSWSIAHSRKTSVLENHTIDEAIAVTLQAGMTLGGKVTDQTASLEGLHQLYALLHDHRRFPGSDITDIQRSPAPAYYRSMINACYHRSFFVTTDGNICLGPKSTREGDVVAILYGGNLPVTLRAHPEYPDDYELVGVAYVHGAMAGEAVAMHRAEGREDDVVCIR